MKISIAHFGETLKKIREEEVMASQAVFARLCEMNPHTISRIERGVVSPNLSTVARIVTALSGETGETYELTCNDFIFETK